MGLIIKANGVTLPSPVSISTTDEILWSSNTGRSTSSGKMLGDVIAEEDKAESEKRISHGAIYF
mgnify:CR=1 FL=1